MEVETSLLEYGNHVRQWSFNPILDWILSVNTLTSIQCTPKVWLAISRGFAIPNPDILSCISFEIQMPDNLEITFEEEKYIKIHFPFRTGLWWKPLHIYRLEDTVSRMVSSSVCKINWAAWLTWVWVHKISEIVFVRNLKPLSSNISLDTGEDPSTFLSYPLICWTVKMIKRIFILHVVLKIK